MLLELNYAQAYAIGKHSVDAEGALIAPAAANVEALWFPVLDLVFLPNTEIMPNDSDEQLLGVGPSVLADLKNVFVHGVNQEICRDQNSPTAASEFRRQISKFHSRAVKFGLENQSYRLENIWAFHLPIREIPRFIFFN